MLLGCICTVAWAAQPQASDDQQTAADDESKELIEEVVVEGQAVDRDKYSVEELKAIAGSGGDPLKALSVIPGIVAPPEQDGPGEEGFYIRGSDLTDNLIRADRQNLGFLFHLGPEVVSIINPSLVKAFDIDLNSFNISNPDRLGGVIAAELRQPQTDRLHHLYRVSLLDANFLVEGPLGERDSFWVGGRRSYFDLILGDFQRDEAEDEEDDEPRILQFPNFFDVQGRWHRQLDDGFMDLTLFAAQDRLTIELVNVEGEDPALAGRLNGNLQFQSLQYRWHQILSDNLLQQVELSVLDDRTVFQIGTQQPDDLNPGESFSLTEDVLTYNLKLEWERALESGGFIKYGVDLMQVNNKQSGYLSALPDAEAGVVESEFSQREKMTLDEDSSLNGVSPYIGSDFSIANGWLLHAGVRLNSFKGGGFADDFASPRLKLDHEPSADLRLYAEFGLQAQLPTASELSRTTGNPTTLKLQKAEQISLGMAWAPTDYWSLKTDLWHKEFDGLVVLRDSLCDRCYANAGDGSASGVDLAWRYAQDETIGYVSYGYISTERQNTLNAEQFPAAGDQPHTLVFAWHQPFAEGSKWSWSAKVSVSSGLPYTRIVGRELCVEEGLVNGEVVDLKVYCPLYGELNSDRLPEQLDVDLSFERRVPADDGGLYIFRLDLLDISGSFYKNVTEYDYGDNFENYENPEEINSESFIPNFAFEWQF